MIPLRKRKVLCPRFMLVLFLLAIVLTVTSNTWKSFCNNCYDLSVPLNSAALIKDKLTLHSFNDNLKLEESKQNTDYIIENNLEENTDRDNKNDISLNDKTVYVNKNKIDNDRENGRRTKRIEDAYRDVRVQSGSGNKIIEKASLDERKTMLEDGASRGEVHIHSGFGNTLIKESPDIDIEGENSESNDTNYRFDLVKVGYDLVDNNGDSNEKNKSALVVNMDWVMAVRARTKNLGILRKRNLHWTIEHSGNYSSELFSPPTGELPRQRLPRAIIFGVGHCGTRALIEFLKMHPYVVPSNNEIHFFDRDINFMKGYEWYKAQMPLSYSNQLTLEKTPSYIWSERAVNEIYKINKNMKLILIMKDPVSRLVSMKLSHHPELLKQMQLVTVGGVLQVNYDSQALIHGVYVKYLKPWLQRYHPSQIHIIEGSDFVKDPANEIIKIESFLGVPHFLTKEHFFYNATKGFYCIRPLHVQEIMCLKDSKGREHPTLDPVVDRMLYDYYRDYNEQLFELLGRRFPWPS